MPQVSGVGKTFALKSKDFYRQILGISVLWKIVNVELDMEGKRDVITAEVDRATKWAPPETKQTASLHKWTERTWRHLDSSQFDTASIANVYSVKHRDGSIGVVAVLWADAHEEIRRHVAQPRVLADELF